NNFTQLCAIPHKQLAKELIITIGERNFNHANPTDFSHPLIVFITEIENEIKKISRYIYTARYIKKLRLATIFPISDSKITYAETLLNRANFIKHTFLS